LDGVSCRIKIFDHPISFLDDAAHSAALTARRVLRVIIGDFKQGLCSLHRKIALRVTPVSHRDRQGNSEFRVRSGGLNL